MMTCKLITAHAATTHMMGCDSLPSNMFVACSNSNAWLCHGFAKGECICVPHAWKAPCWTRLVTVCLGYLTVQQLSCNDISNVELSFCCCLVAPCAPLLATFLCSGRASTCCQVRRGGTLVAQQVQQQEDEKVNPLLHNPTGRYSTIAAPTINL